jgi:hypothetical protein
MAVSKRIKQLFLTKIDEQRFSEALRHSFSQIAFIDGSRWPTALPPLCATIQEASDTDVLLWNRQIVPSILGLKRSENIFQGPLSGVVIMLQRCRMEDHLLLSGSIGWAANDTGLEAEAMSRFAAGVWKILGSISSTRLAWVNPADQSILDDNVAGFLVGLDAIQWCLENSHRRLKYRSTNNYYLPAGIISTESS